MILLLRDVSAISIIDTIFLIEICILIRWNSILICFVLWRNVWLLLIFIFLYISLNIWYVDFIFLIITVWIALIRLSFPAIVTEIRLLNLNLWGRKPAGLLLFRLLILWILYKQIRRLIAANHAIDSHSPLTSCCLVLGTINLSITYVAPIRVNLESFRQRFGDLLNELIVVLSSCQLLMVG